MNINILVDLHLQNYLSHYGFDKDKSFSVLQRQIREGQDLQDRRNMEGHVTSSFLLLDPTQTKILMIYHKRLNKWLCPGGHYEGDVSPRVSALRELEEETGFPSSEVDYFGEHSYLALDVDSHRIPVNPAKDEGEHLHHDFLYLGIARTNHPLVHQEEEVEEAIWKTIEEVVALRNPRLLRVLDKLQDILTANPPVQ